MQQAVKQHQATMSNTSLRASAAHTLKCLRTQAFTAQHSVTWCAAGQCLEVKARDMSYTNAAVRSGDYV
jgi:hypothetical protein